MSQGKFASITDSLLARKGEARPWEDLGKHPSLAWREDCGPPLPSFTPMAPALASSQASSQPAPKAVSKPEAKTEPTMAPFAEVRPSAVRLAPMKGHDVEFSDMSAGAGHSDEPLHHGEDHEKVKKCTVRMSLHDYERLGIIAVKQNVTRQHLLQDALEKFFDTVTEPYQKECACLNAETCCQD